MAPDRVSPAGKLPLAILHVIGEVPDAARVAEYAEPTVPPASDAVVMVGATAAAVMVIDSVFVSLLTGLVASTVKVWLSTVVGVPLIVAPVNVSPAGKLPLVIAQVIGSSPVAAKLSEYGVPTTPPARDAVVIVGGTGV